MDRFKEMKLQSQRICGIELLVQASCCPLKLSPQITLLPAMLECAQFPTFANTGWGV